MTIVFSPVNSPLRQGGRDAVPHPLLIEASAGSGKTWTLAHLASRFMIEDDVEPEHILLVTFTRDAARQLKTRVRQRLVELVRFFESPDVVSPQMWQSYFLDRWSRGFDASVDLARARHSLERVDALEARTIHSFAADHGTTKQGRLADASHLFDQAVRETISRWSLHHRDDFQQWATCDADVSVTQRIEMLRLVSRSFCDAGYRADGRDASVVVAGPTSDDSELDRAAATQVAMANDVVRRFATLLEGAGVTSFADLIADLARRIDGPDAARVRHELRRRFRVVMIDEFQDTDPLQWQIFDRVFRSTTRLIMVGDPKQAIYGFRSGGVETFLHVRDSLGDTGATISLDANFRSTSRYVGAINGLFHGTDFRYLLQDGPRSGRIPFHPSQPASSHDSDRGLTTFDGVDSPLQVRYRQYESSVGSDDRTILAEVEAFVRRARSLERPYAFRDIAILCASNDRCADVLRHLRDHDIPAVTSSSDSIFKSEAAAQAGFLLSALADVNDTGLSSILQLTWFRGVEGGHSGGAVLRLSHEVERVGAIAIPRFLRRADVLEVVASTRDGERNVTDLLHLGEMLADECGSFHSSTQIEEWWLRAGAAQDLDEDRLGRRLESDSDAVRIMTIHKAKGLEFPVVLLPFVNSSPSSLTKTGRTALRQWVDQGVTVIDGGAGIAWGDPDQVGERELLTGAAMAGERRRQLYVALTRAQESVVLWYDQRKATPFASELSRLLIDRVPNDGALTSVRNRSFAECRRIFGAKTPAEKDGSTLDGYPMLEGGKSLFALARTELHRVLTQTLAGVDVSLVPIGDAIALAGPVVRAGKEELQLPAYQLAPLVAVATRRWSYTDVATLLKSGAWIGPTSSIDSEVGGNDEVAVRDHEGVIPSVATVFGSLAGKELGVVVHRVLENAIGSNDPDFAELLDRAWRALEPTGDLEARDRQRSVESFTSMWQRPVGAWAMNSLSSLGATEVSAEMRFVLGLGERSDQLRLRRALDCVAELDSGDGAEVHPFRHYLQSDLPVRSLLAQGFVVGSIDLALQGPDGRFRVIDYKTDQLAGRRPYRTEAMKAHMLDRHYPLQALFYSVAMHRFLTDRLRGYDAQRHWGGVDYFFVRVVGDADADADDGIYTWNISPEAVVAASDALSGETFS